MPDVLSGLFSLNNEDFYKALERFPVVWSAEDHKKETKKRYTPEEERTESPKIKEVDLIIYNIYRKMMAEASHSEVGSVIISPKVVREAIKESLRMLGKPLNNKLVDSWQSLIVTRGLLKKRIPSNDTIILTIEDDRITRVKAEDYVNKRAKYVYNLSYRGVNRLDKFKDGDIEKLLTISR